jgi:hypothetical protein
LPGEPNGSIFSPSIDLTLLTFSSVARKVPVGEGGLLVDARLLEDVLAVVDRARLGEPGQRPRAVAANDLRRLPDAVGIGGLAADVLNAVGQILEAAERGEERHLRRAGLRDVRPLAGDGGVADPVELHVPADDLDVDLHPGLVLERLDQGLHVLLGLGAVGHDPQLHGPAQLRRVPALLGTAAPVVTAGRDAHGQHEDGRDQ